jgi:small GTP-binding protein
MIMILHFNIRRDDGRMGLLEKFKQTSFALLIQKIFGKKHAKIGIYGPPNVGKTTLANRISRDWTGDIVGATSEIPHETRRAKWKSNIKINNGGSSLTIDIVDTPGIATKVDFRDFMNHYGLNEEESRKRAKEATEGVIESIRWLENVDAVVLVMDCTEDPFTQVNVTILGNLEARNLPVLIAANKIDLEESSPATLKSAFPQHPVVPVSALTGYNIENFYSVMTKHFGKKHKKKKVSS